LWRGSHREVSHFEVDIVKITLLDYGAGNVPSVERALQRLGAESRRVDSPEGLQATEALILPGVGHFGALIRALDERSLRAPLLDMLSRGVPFLGICLGLQALYDASDEAPQLRGLRLVSGQIQALPSTAKLPHMGWNQVRPVRASRLLDGIEPGAHFYFAHSYAALAANGNGDAVATCTHGAEFVAVLERRNIFAVQFHPEKSGTAGAKLLHNFLRLAA
jgi:imidazole glycerol phosphate synthase glutamine amidotransferase subunit